jgi:hypothetical protein
MSTTSSALILAAKIFLADSSTKLLIFVNFSITGTIFDFVPLEELALREQKMVRVG